MKNKKKRMPKRAVWVNQNFKGGIWVAPELNEKCEFLGVANVRYDIESWNEFKKFAIFVNERKFHFGVCPHSVRDPEITIKLFKNKSLRVTNRYKKFWEYKSEDEKTLFFRKDADEYFSWLNLCKVWLDGVFENLIVPNYSNPHKYGNIGEALVKLREEIHELWHSQSKMRVK